MASIPPEVKVRAVSAPELLEATVNNGDVKLPATVVKNHL